MESACCSFAKMQHRCVKVNHVGQVGFGWAPHDGLERFIGVVQLLGQWIMDVDVEALDFKVAKAT